MAKKAKKSKKVVQLSPVSSLTELKNICHDGSYPNNEMYQKLAIMAADNMDSTRGKHPTFIDAIKTLEMCAMDEESETGIIDEVNFCIGEL